MKLNFRAKVCLAFLVSIIGCMLLFILLSSFLLKPVFITDSCRKMEGYGTQIDSALMGGAKEQRIDELLTSFYDAYLINTTILNGKQELEYSTVQYGRARGSANPSLPKYLTALVQEFNAQSQNPYVIEFYDNEDQLARIYSIQRTENNDYIILSKSIKGIVQNVHLVSLFLLLAGLLSAAVSVLIWAIFTRSFSRSLERMSQVTKRMSLLDFSKKVNYSGSIQEIHVLAQSIDHMSVQLEQSLSKLQNELKHQKELLRNLSHEIKTPLTTINGYTENMQIVTRGNAKTQRYCAIILEECAALDLLATEMLDVSTLESSSDFYEQKTFEVDELFDRVRERVNRELSDQMIVTTWDHSIICGNAYLLERVIFNYLGNAIKYRVPETTIFLKGQRMGRRYELSVSNSGTPIPEQERDRLWNAFYKRDKSRKRSGSFGIGLSIVKQIANMHHAEVGVMCENGSNRFYFCMDIPHDEQ